MCVLSKAENAHLIIIPGLTLLASLTSAVKYSQSKWQACTEWFGINFNNGMVLFSTVPTLPSYSPISWCRLSGYFQKCYEAPTQTNWNFSLLISTSRLFHFHWCLFFKSSNPKDCFFGPFCLSSAKNRVNLWVTKNQWVCMLNGEFWCLIFFPQCRDALTTRQKLIAQDYKVSYSLAKSCKSDLKKYRCNVENLPRSREARLSYLLMCLESAVHRGKAYAVHLWWIRELVACRNG